MRIKIVILSVMLTAIIFSLGRPESIVRPGEKLIDKAVDGRYTYALISRSGSSEYGDILAVFDENVNGTSKRIYENDFTNLKPWKIESADIDGDGIQEILTAVRKTTHFDGTEKNRLFIFGFDDGKLSKKWTGSQIAGTWKDFCTGDLLPIPGDELIFIELDHDKKQKISIYYRLDFGFVMLGQSKEYNEINDVSVLGENLIRIRHGDIRHEETADLAFIGGVLKELVP